MSSTIDFLSFLDWIEKDEHKNPDWIVVARAQRSEIEDFQTTSALCLLDDTNKTKLLSTPHWDINRAGGEMEFGKPSFDLEGEELLYQSGQEVESEGITFRPLVFFRSHPLNQVISVELTQEFILFHDAFLVPERNEYHRVNEDGDTEIVAKFSDSEKNLIICVNTHMLKDYLAANKSHLIRYHDHRRYSSDDVSSSLKNGNLKRMVCGDLNCFELCIVSPSHHPEFASYSTIMGKDIIPPYPKPLDYHRRRITGETGDSYADFIIALDERGQEVKATCDEKELDTYGAPSYLTSVFFKKEVLTKYYREPLRYRASERHVSCLNKWTLEICENSEGLIHAYLGDLGHIPYKEQLYWKTFNVPPRGGMTQERFHSDFLNDPVEPTDDYVYQFKKHYESVQEISKNRFGEPLFLNLNEDDAHRYSSLRIPLTEEWNEFEEQIQSLAIMTSDSINVTLLKCLTGTSVEAIDERKSLELLEMYLDMQSINESDKNETLLGLKMVQDIRSSGAAHRKGSKFASVLEKRGLDNLSRSVIVKHVFSKLTKSISRLQIIIEAQR